MSTIAKTETDALVAFDYATLSPKVARQARAAAETFRAGHRRITADILTIGAELLTVKDALDHGVFGQWLVAEFGAEERTAQHYMNAARRFGGEPETISDLPLAVVYKLAAPSVPDVARERIVTQLREKRVEAREVATLIAEAKVEAREQRAQEREEARVAKLTPDQAKAEKDRVGARRRARERREAEYEKEGRERLQRGVAAKKNEILAARLIVEALGRNGGQLLELLPQEYGGLSRTLIDMLSGNPIGFTASDFARLEYRQALIEIDGHAEAMEALPKTSKTAVELQFLHRAAGT